MSRQTRKGLWMLICAAPAVVAWTSLNTSLSLQPKSRLWVEGTSTVKSFSCQAPTVDATIEATSPDVASLITAGEKAVQTVELTIPVKTMDCKNGTMNEHMMKALKAKEHETIVFRLSSYDLAQVGEGTKVNLTGTLTLGGVQKTISMIANAKTADDGSLRVEGTHELRMKEYGLKPPTLMMGTMKVNELVKVRFDLLLKA